VPWSNSSKVQQWMKDHADACPDDAQIKCGTTADLQPYFTRRLLSILRRIAPGAEFMGWAPGIEGFYSYGTLGGRYPDVTYDNWNGWDPAGEVNWQTSMTRMTNPNQENASVVLSGPFYVVDPKYPVNPQSTRELNDFEQMMHEEVLNFTASAEAKAKVRGAKLVLWGDASQTDSYTLVPTAGKYMAAMSLSLWSPLGTVPTADPDDHNSMSCNGNDYSMCNNIDAHRCRMLMRGIGSKRARGFGVECDVEYEPPATRPWMTSQLEVDELRAENAALKSALLHLQQQQQQQQQPQPQPQQGEPRIAMQE